MVGGKAIASWIPYTVLVRVDGADRRAVHGVRDCSSARGIPRLTMTVGYDPRFSHGDTACGSVRVPTSARRTEAALRRCGAVEVRGER